jgi:dihydrofolate reductase
VVVNRSIAGPGDAIDWIFAYVTPDTMQEFAEIAAATGAMLMGRRTYEVGSAMEPEPGKTDYPFSGPSLC